MPLDFVTRPGLTDTVRWLGMLPVPDIVLNQHKASEVAKHPPDKGYRYGPAIVAILPMIIIGTLSSAAMCLVEAFRSTSAADVLIQCGWATLPLMLLWWAVRLRPKSKDGLGRAIWCGPARWSETKISNLYYIPIDIMLLARDMQSKVPGSWFVIGELRQDARVLDPYLLLCIRDETGEQQQICLGIWDGDTIIHKAVPIPT